MAVTTGALDAQVRDDLDVSGRRIRYCDRPEFKLLELLQDSKIPIR